MNIDEFKKDKMQAFKKRENDAVTALNVLISKFMLESIEKRFKAVK